MLRALVIISFLTIANGLNALTANELITKMHEVYQGKTRLSYSCKYELYKGHKSNEVEDSYEGFIYKADKNLYQKINHTEMIYTPSFAVKIDHENKAMQLMPAQKNIQIQGQVEQYLKDCEKVKLESKSGKYQLVFYFKDAGKYPMSLVKMTVDKTTYLIEQLDYYYSTSQNFSKDPQKSDYQQAHLRIKFSKYNEKSEHNASLFEMGRYVKKENDKWLPQGEFKGYELNG